MSKPVQNRPVLVVDDDPEERTATCKALGPRHPVLTAASGQEALRMARETRCCAIVMDVMMAKPVSGVTLRRELERVLGEGDGDSSTSGGSTGFFSTSGNRVTP